MKFGSVREKAKNQWLIGTGRQRVNESDNIEQSYECSWQLKFQSPESAAAGHFSVFCSMGTWNTILSDFLTDERWDSLHYDSEEDRDIIFRQYTKILLAVSEILTDFQDMLTTLDLARRPSKGELKNGTPNARSILNGGFREGTINAVFNYINNVCKHKCSNIHMCNHHLHLLFEDSPQTSASSAVITLDNLAEYIGKDSTKVPDTLIIPPLGFFIELLLNGYKILDEQFRGDSARFDAFCELYKGHSCRA